LQWPWFAEKSGDAKNGTAPSDAELAERLKRRDENAFLNLYDLHRSTVFRFLMYMTGSAAAAEELAQEVFVAILDAMCAGTLTQFDPERGTWEGYLLGIARNLARANRRKENRVVSLDSVLDTPEWNRQLATICQTSPSWDVATLVATRSELEVLQRAILELPEHYRGALVLCALQEKSYRDAGAILQCSEGTVASRVNRAKSILAAKLRKSGTNRGSVAAMRRRKESMDARAAIKTERS
jgi:RNA polymerase sigma-70 factor (ECF subfamily)